MLVLKKNINKYYFCIFLIKKYSYKTTIYITLQKHIIKQNMRLHIEEVFISLLLLFLVTECVFVLLFQLSLWNNH